VREISFPSLELVLGHSNIELVDVRGEGGDLQSDIVKLVNNVFELILILLKVIVILVMH
jgi:hypothetical protein